MFSTIFVDFWNHSKSIYRNFLKSKTFVVTSKTEKWNIHPWLLCMLILTKIKLAAEMPKWSAREWSKYPYFREFSTLELNISRTKFFRARPLKAFFIPMTGRIGYTHFWGDSTAVQKNTPLGGRPHRIFFSTPKPHSGDLLGSEKHHFKGIWILALFSSF